MHLGKFFILSLLVSCHFYSAHAMNRNSEDYIDEKTEKLSIITPHTGIQYRGKLIKLRELPTDNLYDDLDSYYAKKANWTEKSPFTLKSWLKPNTFDPIDEPLKLFEVTCSRWVNDEDQKGVVVIWSIQGDEDSLDDQIDAYKKEKLNHRNNQIKELLKGSYYTALKAFAVEFQKDNKMYYSENMTSVHSDSGATKKTNPGFKKTLDALKLEHIEAQTEEVTPLKKHLSFGNSQVEVKSVKK